MEPIDVLGLSYLVHAVDRILSDYYDSRDQLEPATILRISRQLLEAIRFIHDAGMGHGGMGEPLPTIFTSLKYVRRARYKR